MEIAKTVNLTLICGPWQIIVVPLASVLTFLPGNCTVTITCTEDHKEK